MFIAFPSAHPSNLIRKSQIMHDYWLTLYAVFYPSIPHHQIRLPSKQYGMFWTQTSIWLFMIFENKNIKAGTMEPTKSLCSSDVFLPSIIIGKLWICYLKKIVCGKIFLIAFFAFVIHKKKRPRQPLNQDLLPMRRLDLLSTHNSWFIFHLSEKFSFCASRALGLKGGRGWVAFYCSWKADTLYLIDGEFEHWRNVCACNHCKLS